MCTASLFMPPHSVKPSYTPLLLTYREITSLFLVIISLRATCLSSFNDPRLCVLRHKSPSHPIIPIIQSAPQLSSLAPSRSSVQTKRCYVACPNLSLRSSESPHGPRTALYFFSTCPSHSLSLYVFRVLVSRLSKLVLDLVLVLPVLPTRHDREKKESK